MRRLLYITPDEDAAKSGGGSDAPGGSPAGRFRSQGFLAAAFGTAVGLTLMLLFGLLRLEFFKPLLQNMDIVDDISNIWLWFLFGFIGGTFVSLVYNLLVTYRLNLFGLERNMD